MAVHYTERAALLDLAPSKKLVLMCMADSANQHDRIGFPGIEALQKWSGLKSRSRVFEVIGELVDLGLLVRHRAGINGRRAEFVVFPRGCCSEHGPLKGYEESPEGHGNPGSGQADPDPEEEKSQGPVEGPIQGPAQTGPLPFSPPPVVTREGTPHVSKGSGAEPPQEPTTPPAVAAAPPGVEVPEPDGPEPSTRCGTHALAPASGPCPGCGDARREHAAWVARVAARTRAREAAARQAAVEAKRLARLEVAACRLCNDDGIVSVPAGMVRCTHDPSTTTGQGRAEFAAVREAQRKRRPRQQQRA